MNVGNDVSFQSRMVHPRPSRGGPQWVTLKLKPVKPWDATPRRILGIVAVLFCWALRSLVTSGTFDYTESASFATRDQAVRLEG
jgi:hypothetical protein